MGIQKKLMKSIVALSLCLCTILSVAVINVSAAEPKKVMEYISPLEDVQIFAYSTEGGTVECTKATAGFVMETGIRVYKATPKEGYKFDGWSYSFKLIDTIDDKETDKGNRISLGRYTFSKVGNKKVAYDGKSNEIQLNRLSACGEFFNTFPLCYTITANFSEI